VEQEDVLNIYPKRWRATWWRKVKNVGNSRLPRMIASDGEIWNDKPDIRFGMEFGDLSLAWKAKTKSSMKQKSL
jgi:aspartyl-tRNA synthetase